MVEDRTNEGLQDLRRETPEVRLDVSAGELVSSLGPDALRALAALPRFDPDLSSLRTS